MAYLKPLFTVAATRAIEKTLFASVSSYAVMRQAGAAVASAAKSMLAENSAGAGKEAVIFAVAGGGNNGGDATVAAQLLAAEGYCVRHIAAAAVDTLPTDARRAFDDFLQDGRQSDGLEKYASADGSRITLPDCALIIDGVFGIGLSRPPQGAVKKLLAAINAARGGGCRVLSIDVPSGLAADSGVILGKEGGAGGGGDAAVRADKTLTFFGGKPGLYTADGAEISGEVMVDDLGMPPAAASGWLLDAPPPLAPLRRRRNTHKGSYKTLALIGGAAGMVGALVLAARAAAQMGAGKTLACPLVSSSLAPCPPLDWLHPEILWRPLSALPAEDAAAGGSATALADIADCFAAGMGSGTAAAAKESIGALINAPKPLLLDADALNLLAAEPRWLPLLRRRQAATLLTPHPGEAARLGETSTAAIENNRFAAAAALCEKYNAVVILKGAGTIIHCPAAVENDGAGGTGGMGAAGIVPQGGFIVCGGGNAGLARGGSGDVLSGICAALLAQSGSANFAAAAGVWLHAAAGDRLSAQHGEIGLDVNRLAATAAQLVHENL